MANTILDKRPRGQMHSKGREYNYHGDDVRGYDPIASFCGENVLDAVEKLVFDDAHPKSQFIYFETDAHEKCHICKYIRNGVFGYNVYYYTEIDSENNSNRTGKKTCEEKQSRNKKRINRPWRASDRARNYPLEDKPVVSMGKDVGNLIAYSYLEKEKKIIDEYNHNVSDQYRIFPCAFFELGLQGQIDNAICLICFLNSGFCDDPTGPNDIDAYEDPQLRRVMDNIRSGKLNVNIALSKEASKLKKYGKQYPFVSWTRQKCNGNHYAGRQWLLDIAKEISGVKDDELAFDWLAPFLASRDLYYYHTHNGDRLRWQRACQKTIGKGISIHQEIIIDDLRKAQKLNVPIILCRARAEWLDFVPELQSYPLLFCCASVEVGYLSSGNVLLYKDCIELSGNDGKKAKHHAWNCLKEAMQNRFQVLNQSSH